MSGPRLGFFSRVLEEASAADATGSRSNRSPTRNRPASLRAWLAQHTISASTRAACRRRSCCWPPPRSARAASRWPPASSLFRWMTRCASPRMRRCSIRSAADACSWGWPPGGRPPRSRRSAASPTVAARSSPITSTCSSTPSKGAACAAPTRASIRRGRSVGAHLAGDVLDRRRPPGRGARRRPAALAHAAAHAGRTRRAAARAAAADHRGLPGRSSRRRPRPRPRLPDGARRRPGEPYARARVGR